VSLSRWFSRSSQPQSGGEPWRLCDVWGLAASPWVAYVGEGGNLASRIDQHFVRRDSSVATGVAAATLNPDAVREVRWWEDASFDAKAARQAAELVAFRVLDPALRSRGGIGSDATALAADASFRDKMELLFRGEPAGVCRQPWIWDMETRIEQLENEVADLKKRLGG
jgi:hypothetical protein